MRPRPRIHRRVPRRRSIAARLRRHPFVYWLVAVSLMALTAQALSHAFAAAARERRQWGERREVYVARRHVDAGAALSADDVDLRSWPVVLLPAGALTPADAADLAGRTVVSAIEPGEVMVAGRLAPGGVHGVAALVPIGWRALALPFGSAVLPVSVGDRVDLVAAVEADQPGVVLATGALVVAVDDRSITVAVPAADAPRVALGIATGAVVPALRSG